MSSRCRRRYALRRRGVAQRKRTCFGGRRSWVQIPPPRPICVGDGPLPRTEARCWAFMAARPGRFPLPTGEQYEIRHGPQSATVTEVGATLRAYSLDAIAVIDGFDDAEFASGGRGQVLAPWPNRLSTGRYSFDGRDARVPINEAAGSNAIHGLVRWLPWQPVSHSADAVRLRCVLHPQPAYPWRLELQVEYRLGPGGLTTTASATNQTAAPAPFGIGFHPYVTVGTPLVDDAWLHVAGYRRLIADADGIPVDEAPVAGTPYDYTQPRAVGTAHLDTAYTDLERDGHGRATAVLDDRTTGRSVALWMDGGYRYLMVFTGDTVKPPERRRRSVALEPMTCPPNAFRSGRDLIALDPGATWQGSWGLALHATG